MNRIEARMNDLSKKKEKAFITYITAGLPSMEKTEEIIKAQVGITDVIELGIPFSDPIADGPVIQQASYEAIQKGASLAKTFDLMKKIRNEGIEQPILFMMYYNTIYYYGLDEFAKTCSRCGVDGLIVPDLPFEEQADLRDALAKYDDTILIQLVSPVSKNRVPEILEDARGFVYCVSAMGVTGQSGSFHREIESYLKEVKAQSKIPVMMGFGISKARDVEPVANTIDGAIVGSYFINLLRENNFDANVAKEYVNEFKRDLNNI